ncbi:MAG: flippase [Chloroflexi bacterium]|nr:flippase [Chloroflexota bacterium]
MTTYLRLLRDALLALVFHVAPRFANVIIFVVVGRLAGPDQAGVFSLATTYLLIATTLMRGLDDLLIRQVAREPDRSAHYFGNFLVLRLGLSTLAYAVLIALTNSVPSYSASTAATITVLAFSVIPDSLTHVAQAILLGHRRFGPSAVVLGGASLFKLIIGIGLLARGGSLVEIAWIWLGGSGLSMIVMLTIAIRQVGGMRRTDWLNFSLLKAQRQAAFVFGAATVLTALDSQTDTLLLSVFHGEREVGWYGAATTITAGLLMMSQAYRFAVYPLMARYAQSTSDKLAVLFQKSVHYMGVVAMPLVTGIIVFAPQLIDLIFGPAFLPTVRVLQILVISLLFFFMSEPCNRLMLVKDRQRVLVSFLAVSALTNIALNLLLIPTWGAGGAAVARTCSSMLFFFLNQGYIMLKVIKVHYMHRMISPLLSSAIMAIVSLCIIRNSVVLAAITSSVIYVFSLWLTKGIMPDDVQRLRNAILNRPSKNPHI